MRVIKNTRHTYGGFGSVLLEPRYDINTADSGDHDNRGNHLQPPANQKEKRPFWLPADVIPHVSNLKGYGNHIFKRP
jgi:hypothetical protein